MSIVKGQRSKASRGFTLIEIIIYSGIVVIISTGFILYVYSTLDYSNRVRSHLEVTDNSRLIIQKISGILRGAVVINSPAVGFSGASLSADTHDIPNNPFIFDLSSGVLRLKRGGASPVPISNSLVTVSSLSFANYSYSNGTKNTIRIKALITSATDLPPASQQIDFFVTIQ